MNTIKLFQILYTTTIIINNLANLLKLDIKYFRIGGSIALSTVLPSFNRRIHDIDIIINITDSKYFNKIKENIEFLATINNREVSPGKTSYFITDVTIDKITYPVNIILDNNSYTEKPLQLTTKDTYYIQHPSIIKYAKQSYSPIRDKDTKDIALIEAWEKELKLKDFLSIISSTTAL